MISNQNNSATQDDVLSKVTIAHSPMIAKNRKAIGTRLSISAGESLPASVLVGRLGQYFGAFHAVIFLGLYGVTYDSTLLDHDYAGNVVLEIPGDDFNRDDVQELVRGLHKKGVTLAIRGRAEKPLPPEFVDIFKYSVMHASEEKRVKREVDSKILAMRKIRFIMTGIASVSDVDEAFERGAVASAGWPMDEAPTEDLNNFKLSTDTLQKLSRLVEARAAHQEIETVVKQDPALAYKLLRHLNSASFGNSLQIEKFRQAFLIIGYANLARWVEDQLSTAPAKDDNVYPLMHASLRRGLFMESLSGGDKKTKDAFFMTGAFSLLDKITKTSFNRLMSLISISNDIVMSLTSDRGPWSGFLSLVVAVEQNDIYEIREKCEALNLSLADVNRALLTALAAAEDVESDDFEKNIS
jgi:EAL and modified HD-GYP domain-containing signal transduction protein